MPSGKITQSLLNDYKLGILSVFMNKKLFKNNKFDKKYNIIGDFDFFIRLSLKEKFYCIHKPLAFYRNHDTNFSKKTSLYTKEMSHWVIKNTNRFEKLNYSLKRIKYMHLKLKLKNLIKRAVPFYSVFI